MHYGGYSYCHYPVYADYGCGYSYPVTGGCSFALIVVLFILLIIIGATCFGGR
ncbi:YjcZ family sporulation protein [Caldibacillus thermolactis]|jgi:uncharacterized protein (TIGR01732 family)|uniref:YjcZ family sporulation protein n=1 Tax=Pallidibacillus thermolactis TaxID=251051 RepID=A0ABT2WM24_9BACI|nr:YjcZ family sporulation protein [Pallidibacillus thermolactis]MCU9595754.1 YjcZ family sporulation protein [Pallidibacillus thermolactis]MCU9602016.1 YjcZ family sporulation protein [Pallidibacillus thermolactis subsp. kokeshiiformis]MED1673607.1 YjcZ family sporulation protein [Pallidibacillus thermolactis subsp. kokeshiiformis]